MKNLRFILVLSLFALFASIFSLQKLNLQNSKPFFLIGIRMTIAGAILLIYKIKTDEIKIKKTNYKDFAYLAIFNIYLNSIFEIWGLNNMSSSKACMLYSISPFLTALIAFFVLNEKLTKKKIIGLLIGFSGLIPMFYEKTTDEIAIKKVLALSLSEISLLSSVLFSVVGWIFLKKIIKNNYSYIIANGISMFTGGLLILTHSYFFENWNSNLIINKTNFLIYTLITCAISNIICYNLFGYLLNFFSTTFMTFAGLITPFFAAFFGYLFLNENITINFFISIIIFLFGLKIFYEEENKS